MLQRVQKVGNSTACMCKSRFISVDTVSLQVSAQNPSIARLKDSRQEDQQDMHQSGTLFIFLLNELQAKMAVHIPKLRNDKNEKGYFETKKGRQGSQRCGVD